MVDPEDEALDARAEAAAALLEELVADRGGLAELTEPLRRRLLTAAGQVSRPERGARRKLAKAFRRKEKLERRAKDEAILDETGIRALRAAQIFATPALAPGAPRVGEAPAPPRLNAPRKCYVCKAEFDVVHPFYDQLCHPCGDVNFGKREQSADLSGQVVLITGARVKIGYQAAIKLLRAGAHVVVTTRFARDAAARYAREEDFASFGHRLTIYGLDLRHTPSVEEFARELAERFDRLDHIIHNACQTVRRPPGFYGHLLEGERRPLDSLPAMARASLAIREPRDLSPSELSQLELVAGDEDRSAHLFPSDQLDEDLQQIDLRELNSWRLPLAEVPTVELLEVFLVNAVAPFVLNARLKALMSKGPGRGKHIVNVSAMEGQFYRDYKTDKHPHTNMAKAALNMMTRTSSADYVLDGIHMNSVDTGWVTDEDPAELAARKREEHRFHPPLDIVDGAARIVDPIFSGVNSGEHRWGIFFKDYEPTDW